MYTAKMKESHRKHPLRRRDYEFIAAVLKYLPPTTSTREQVAKSFAAAMIYMPGFDKERFFRACGVIPTSHKEG